MSWFSSQRARVLLWSGAALVAGLALGAAATRSLSPRAPAPAAPPSAAPASRAGAQPQPAPPAAHPSAWRELPASSPLAGFADVAFAADAVLVTNGQQASFQPGGAEPRPIEVPAALPRVFAAAGRLFAAGENEGAPFLIGLSRDQAPMVVPMPCLAVELAGAGEYLLAACDGGKAIATSSNGGSRFRKTELELPDPALPQGVAADASIDALACGADGSFALAVAQRWRIAQGPDELLWSWAHVGVQPDRGELSWRAVPALARAVGLQLEGGALTLAGLEVAAGGSEQGELRPRFWRAGEAGPLEPQGEPGPACGIVARAADVEGVLLGPREAAFLCEGEVVLTLDGGASWWKEQGFAGRAEKLRGGEMRLVVRADGKVFERRFATRSPAGAVAVRVGAAPAAAVEAGGEAAALAHDSEVREPELDAGVPD